MVVQRFECEFPLRFAHTLRTSTIPLPLLPKMTNSASCLANDITTAGNNGPLTYRLFLRESLVATAKTEAANFLPQQILPKVFIFDSSGPEKKGAALERDSKHPRKALPSQYITG